MNDIFLFTDIDECSENISGCAQNCMNTIGGYNCSCKKGYQLGIDEMSCIGKSYIHLYNHLFIHPSPIFLMKTHFYFYLSIA